MTDTNDYVLGFIFSTDEKHLLLISKRRPAWQHGYLNGVGGKIDYEKDLKPSTAMMRECREECALQIWEHQWRPFCVMNFLEPALRRVFCFVTHAEESVLFSARAVTDEAIMIVRMDHLHEQRTVHSLHWLLALARDKQIKDPVTVVFPEQIP